MTDSNPRSDPTIVDARQTMEGLCCVCVCVLFLSLFHTAVANISKILGTGLDMDTLLILTRLTELDVNPEALAAVVSDLRSSHNPS